jgi:outer membrane receptor for ferrienterochelin and colicin
VKYSRLLALFLYAIISFHSNAQSGSIKGRVYNQINNEPIAFATVSIDSIINSISDENGDYIIKDLTPGTYNVSCSFLGFEKVYITELTVTSTKPTILDIPLIEALFGLDVVEVTTTSFKKAIESPLSLRVINASEIYRSPGGNRDISKVLQVIPGVASTLSFRNDIIVRGGAPNENRFYMDGIEIPNINHFATQGSSGGPVGMINVNFLREVDFYSGAFPANRGNALSSVIDIEQLNGNDEKISGTLMLGSSDMGLTLEGPLGKNSVFMLSARRSYLQVLFKALNLPFLPTYTDFQYKHLINLDEKNQLTIIGLGAIDDFKLNTSVNEKLTDEETIKRNDYILGVLPVNTQNNYVVGVKWSHFSEHSFQTFVMSRNHLNNKAFKYKNNMSQPEFLLFDYDSSESENKFRFESTKRKNGWKFNVGLGLESVLYENATFNLKEINGTVSEVNFNSELSFVKFAVFSQLSHSFYDDKLQLSLGARSDFNNYSNDMNSPLKQFSPRFSLSYKIAPKVNANFNIGRFFQLPPYTVMGYRNNALELINKQNDITYIQSNHIVAGLEYNFSSFAKLSMEAFHKAYDKYPFLINDQISLANLGGDFGVIGNEEVTSTSKGRSYGMEFFLQQKLSNTVYGMLSYTWVRSEFKNQSGAYIPSSWDNKHILNLTAGKRLKKNWEMGLKFRLLGGAPYTPYDIELSSRRDIWDVTQTGINDWSKLNTERNPVSHALDIRIDKKWFYKKLALNLYLDIQNVYNTKTKTQPYVDVIRDEFNNPVQNPENGQYYLIDEIENTSGTILPSIGIMLEF